MADPFIGEIRLFGFNFPPRGWATCDGQLLPIAQNTALFSLLGTQFGGNGTNNFALPDLRGRVPLHMGQGPGLSPYTIGQVAGEEKHQLLTTELPAHNHALLASSGVGTVSAPSGAVLAAGAPTDLPRYTADSIDVTLSANSVGLAGSGAAHNNLQPYLTINFCIALVGIFPSRN